MLKCGLVLWTNRRQVHEGTGYVHAFPAADWTPVLNLAANRSVGRSIGGEDGQPNQAVVDENGVSGFSSADKPPYSTGKSDPPLVSML